MTSYRSTVCRRLEALGRRVRARLLHWIATGGAIDECEGTALGERELATLSEAIARARRAGR